MLCVLLGCARPGASPGSDLPPARTSLPPPDCKQQPGAPSCRGQPPPPLPLVVTGSPTSGDAIAIHGLGTQGSTLEVRVAHPGGCAEHTYRLEWDGAFQPQESGVERAELVLVHEDGEDACDRPISASLQFDLTPLVRRWRERHGVERGAVDVRLAGSPSTARFEF